MGLELRSGSATDVGNVRPNNQDDLLVLPGVLFAVADGMGGHAAGEVASRQTVETLRSSYGDERTIEAFRDAIRWANRAVWRRGIDEPEHAGMGTTLTAVAVLDDGQLAVANIGDSRTYLLREGTLSQLTSDHSFVQEAVRSGQLTREQAESHPRRSQLTRAMGIGDDVEADIEVLAPRDGDRLLLCSDGLWDELPDEAITSILQRLRDPDEAAAELVRQAKEAGGRDNVTVVVVDVLDADEERQGLAASRALAAEGDEPTVAAPAVALDRDGDGPEDLGAPPADEASPLLERSSALGADADLVADTAAPRLVTWRVVLFLLVLAAIGVAAFVVFRGGSSPWRVKLSGNNVAIFKGDELRTPTPLQANQLDPKEQVRLRRGVALDTEAEARRYVDGLARQVASTMPTATSTTGPPTTPAPTTASTAAPPPPGGP